MPKINHVSNLFFTILLIVCFANCKSKKSSVLGYKVVFDLNDLDTLHEIELKRQDKINPYPAEKAARIFEFDSLIVSLNDSKEGLITIYNSNDHKLIAKYGKAGTGLGEFIGLNTLSMIRNENARFLLALDITQRKITIINIDSVLSNKTYVSKVEKKLTGVLGSAVDFVCIKNSTLVSINFNDSFRLAFFHLRDTATYTKGVLPIARKYKYSPPNILTQANQAHLAISSDSRFIALAYKFSDLLEIYDTAGNRLAATKGPDMFDPLYSIGSYHGYPMFELEGKSKIAFGAVHCTRKFVYALYLGQTVENYTGYNNLILVFDFLGHLINKMRLDYPISDFICNDNSGLSVIGLSKSKANKPEIDYFQ
jgi:TolB-like 6-blade propeller-like